jgi:hypothetical protein
LDSKVIGDVFPSGATCIPALSDPNSNLELFCCSVEEHCSARAFAMVGKLPSNGLPDGIGKSTIDVNINTSIA